MKKTYRKKIKRNKTKRVKRKKYSKKKYSKKKHSKKNMKGGSMGDALALGVGAVAGGMLGLGSMGVAGLAGTAGVGRRLYNNTLCQCNGCNSCLRPSSGGCGPASHTTPWKNKWYPHNCCRGRFQNLPGVPRLDINGKCRECNLALANSLGYQTFQEYLEARRVYSHGPGPHDPRWEYIKIDERKKGHYIYPHKILYEDRYISRNTYTQMVNDGFEYGGSAVLEEQAEEAAAEELQRDNILIQNVLDYWMAFIKDKQDRRQHLIENVIRKFLEKANLGWLPAWRSRWENGELEEKPDITGRDLNELMKQSKKKFEESLQE